MNSPASRRGDIGTLVAAVTALLPGFVFPFLLPLLVGEGVSDTYFLAISIALTLTNVVGNAIELNSVAEFGRAEGSGGYPGPAARRDYTRRIALFSLCATILVAPPLFIVYFLNAHQPGEFAAVAGIVAGTPLLAGFTSIFSGRLIASGRSSLAVIMQAPRSGLPLLVALVVPDISLIALALAFVCAEVLRLVVLSFFARRLGRQLPETEGILNTRGMTWQSLSAAVAQGGPVTDRVFLSSTVGAVTTYEIADKVYFAAVQFLNLGLLVRRVGNWSRMYTSSPGDARRMLVRDFSFIAAAALTVGIAGIIVVIIVNSMGIVPSAWARGLTWSAILLASLPLGLVSMAAGRVLVIAGRQRTLLWMSVLTFVGNATLDAIFFALYGVDGIPIATALLRLVAVIVYLSILHRVVPRVQDPPSSA